MQPVSGKKIVNAHNWFFSSLITKLKIQVNSIFFFLFFLTSALDIAHPSSMEDKRLLCKQV